jgi:hypothetical protein
MNPGYSIEVLKQELRFRSPFYKVQRGSVLHRGFYNPEMASLLVSTALAGGMLIALLLWLGPRMWLYGLALVCFAGLFVLLRLLVFRRRQLSLGIDKAKGTITIKPPLRGERVFDLSELKELRSSHHVLSPENPDGIAMVEKIALQHGTVIPGFGETLELYSVELLMKDGSLWCIYVDKSPQEPDKIVKTIKEFLGRDA